MNDLITTDIVTGAAMPIKKGTLDFLQTAYKNPLSDILKISGAGIAEFTALWGCKNSGSYVPAGTAIISAGSVVQDASGITFRTKTANFVIGVGETIVGNFVTSYYSSGSEADPVTFTNGVPHNVHRVTEIEWSSGVSGSGFVDFLDVVRPVKKKIIPIGVWDMDVDADITIAHGFADSTQILSAKAAILDDLVSFSYPLDMMNFSTPGSVVGGVTIIDNTDIGLSRVTGEIFDDAGCSITPTVKGIVTRGWIVIEYIG